MERKRTLGPLSADLIVKLVDEGKRIFRISDVERITGKRKVRKLLYKLVKRNVIRRLASGRYMIIPTEAGSITNYIENYYVVARELAYPRKYYIAYYSALAVHDMLTQPLTKVYISSTSRVKNVKINGIEFKFIYCNPKRFWGFKEVWVTRQEKASVSDIEKTILDCLGYPQYAGGISEIAKGIWIKRRNIDFDKLISYAKKLDRKASVKRAGYILEVFNIDKNVIRELQEIPLAAGYVLLDPLLLKSGKYLSKWGLLLNVEADELRKVTQT